MSLFVVDLGHPVMFCHVPKTGGRSIRQGRTVSGPALYDRPDDWQPMDCFAVVRDPFDRVESAWRDFRFLRPQTDKDFEPFVDWVFDNLDRESDTKSAVHHASPFTNRVHGIQEARFILRYEHLEDDLREFCQSRDLAVPKLSRVGAAGDTPRAFRSKKLVEKIKALYSADYSFIERFRDGRAAV